MTTIEKQSVSIDDFTLTVDTELSGGDKVVLHVDREGCARLTMACGTAQLLWLVDDPDYFANAYRFAVFKRVAERRDEGWSFARVAAELGVDADWVETLHREVLAAMPTEATA